MPRSREFNEEEILKKAMFLFWKQGYYDTSIKDLIAFLGISNASIYNAFGGKKQLFYKAFEYYQQSNYQGLKHFLESQDNIKKGLSMAFQKLIHDDYADEDCKGCFIVNTTTELLPNDKNVQRLVEQNRVRVESLFQAFLEKGVASGQLPAHKNTEVLARLLYTMMTGIRVLGKTKSAPSDTSATVDEMLLLLT